MSSDEQIEKCAQLCDSMVSELDAMKPKARKGKYDRQSSRQIDYAIRAVRRVAERIRALAGVTQEAQQPESNGDRLTKALAIARELRPIIAQTRDSAWKQDMLRRLDEVVR